MPDTKEILMRIGNGGGADLEAECQAALRSAPADPLMRDFAPGRFFEIKDFSLSVGLHDKDAAAQATKEADQARHAKAEPARPGKPQAAEPAKKIRKFAGWRDGLAGARYPLEVQPVSFSRVMDRASTTLLQNLCQSKSYASATIVRRLGTGQDLPRAYLRLEFSCVLVTSIDWDDDDLVQEKYKFICQGVSVQYKSQQADAFLGALVQGKWPLVS